MGIFVKIVSQVITTIQHYIWFSNFHPLIKITYSNYPFLNIIKNKELANSGDKKGHLNKIEEKNK